VAWQLKYKSLRADFFKFKVEFTGLVLVFGLCAALATGLSFLGRAGWLFELTTHFRPHYALVLLAIAIWCWVRRERATASVFALPGLVNLAILLPFFVQSPEAAPAGESRLRLLLINVGASNPRADLVRAVLRETKPDVVILQEITARWLNKLADLKYTFPHQLLADREDDFGMALLSRVPLTDPQIVYLGVAELPTLQARVPLGDETVLVTGTHPLPPTSPKSARRRNEQLQALADTLAGEPGLKIVLGDLNMTPWSPYYKRFLEQTGLADTALGQGLHATWPAHLGALGIPLDHCLASPELPVIERHVGPPVGSDHLPLLVELARDRSVSTIASPPVPNRRNQSK